MADNGTVLVLMLILGLALIVPELFKRLRLPFVTSIIVAGAVLGPQGLGYVEANEVVLFFAFLGAAFLLLMAGLETRLGAMKTEGRSILVMAAFNGLIPFIVGLSVTRLLGYSWLNALVVGTVFISSSIAIVIGSIHSARLQDRPIGRSILGATMVADIACLLVLSIILQSVAPITKFPLGIYFILLVMSVLVLRLFVPEIAAYFFTLRKKDTHEGQLRFVIVVFMAVLLYFSGLGVHPYIAAFFVGLLLSEVVTSDIVYSKLHTIGYGMFVPVFFFAIGMDLRLDLLLEFDHTNVIMLVIGGSFMVAKVVSGFLGARVAGYGSRDALTFGIASLPQLTTTLAATYAALSAGLLDSVLVTTIVMISVVTTVLSPILLGLVRRMTYD